MKLAEIETFVTVPPTGIGGSFWVLVQVTTDDGVTGVGECYGIPFSPGVATSMVTDMFDRYIVGSDPHDLETMYRRVYSAGFTQRPDPTVMSIFSGIEIAIWDILGKAAGKPVHQLLGGAFHDRLRTYTYLYPASAHRPLGEDAPETPEPDPYHDPARRRASVALRRAGLHRREAGPDGALHDAGWTRALTARVGQKRGQRAGDPRSGR